LRKFVEGVIKNIIIKNVDADIRADKANDCQSFFSHEIMLMTLRAYDLLNKKITQLFKKSA